MDIVLLLGLIFALGSFASKLTARMKISNVIGYVCAGVLLGIFWPGIRQGLSNEGIKVLGTIISSLITFMIGGELTRARISGIPKGTIGLLITQSLFTFAAVFSVTYFMIGQSVGFSVILGAIGAASAPAATLMAIKKKKAQGPFIDALLPLVALDDVITVILINVAIVIATATENFGSLLNAVSMSVWDIFGSIIIGIVIGIALGYLLKNSKGGDEVLFIVLGSIFLGAGLASKMHTSTILASMVAGITVANMVYAGRKLFSAVERLFPPLQVILFTITGIFFDFRVFWINFPIFVAYILARIVGKLVGSKIGASLTHKDKQHGNFLGMSILSQSGLALALAFAICGDLPEYRSLLMSTIVPAVLFFEIIAPSLIILALDKTKSKVE